MRITNIEAIALKVPLGKERFYSSQCPFPERNSLLDAAQDIERVAALREAVGPDCALLVDASHAYHFGGAADRRPRPEARRS
jgi:L-alanine-DL-glutamate epimerase-like enolase superfamily enzyme